MALNMNKMKSKMSSLQSSGNGKRWFWKPQDGEQTIRIVPDAGGDPFREFWFHYNLGDKPGFLSPKRNFGEDCPLDTFVRKLWEDGSDESRELAKKLMAKQRFFSPVIVRGEEDQGVRLWGYSKTVYEKLLGLVLNPDYGDITDVENGHDFKIVKIMEGQWPKYDQSAPRPKSTPAGSGKEVAEWMDSLHDVHGLVKLEEYEDVLAVSEEITPPSMRPRVLTETPGKAGSDDEFLTKMQS